MITDFFMYNERMSKSVSYVDLGSCQLSWGEKGKKGKMSHELGTELLTLNLGYSEHVENIPHGCPVLCSSETSFLELG